MLETEVPSNVWRPKDHRLEMTYAGQFPSSSYIWMLTGKRDSLGESNWVAARNALNMNTSVALNLDLEVLAQKKLLVEVGEGGEVLDVGLLSDIDNLEGIAGGLGEVDRGESPIIALDEHLTGEWFDRSMDLAVAADDAVDGHGELGRFRVGHDDALDGELGLIELALGDLGDRNKKTGTWSAQGTDCL